MFPICSSLSKVDAIFGPYVKGKRRAEAAVAEQFGADGVILHLATAFSGYFAVDSCGFCLDLLQSYNLFLIRSMLHVLARLAAPPVSWQLAWFFGDNPNHC